MELKISIPHYESIRSQSYLDSFSKQYKQTAKYNINEEQFKIINNIMNSDFPLFKKENKGYVKRFETISARLKNKLDNKRKEIKN